MKAISSLLLLFLLACSNGGNNDLGENPFFETSNTQSLVSKTSDLVEQTIGNKENQDQKIIKTAQLTFETKDVQATHQKILNLASQNKGFVQSDNSGKSYNQIFQNLVIRVPSENFQKFVDGISEGVEYFEQKEISQQDVSEEFVDLEARLKAKRELENRYLELLKKANSVKDMLEIERELSNIREEIEAKQGLLQFLQSQVSMSVVNIQFYKTTSDTGITKSYGQKMKNALSGGWNGISVLFLGILYLWPLFFVALIIVIVVRIFLRRRKIKK